MADNKSVIEVVTVVEDKTKDGAASAENTVSKLERAMKKAQDRIKQSFKRSLRYWK